MPTFTDAQRIVDWMHAESLSALLWLRDWVPHIESELAEGPLVPPVYERAADHD